MVANGELVIDGTDVWQAFGAVILEGGCYDVLALPSTKSPDTYDWFEEDAVEIDFELPALNNRRFSLRIGVLQGEKGLKGIMGLLLDRNPHRVKFGLLGGFETEAFCSGITVDSALGKAIMVTATFEETYLKLPPVGTSPTGLNLPHSPLFRINGTNIGKFGCVLLEDRPILDRIKRELKAPARRESRYLSGSRYISSGFGKVQQTDIWIDLLMYGNSWADILSNMGVLLQQLLAGTTYQDESGTLPAYYSSSQVKGIIGWSGAPRVHYGINLKTVTR